MHDRQPMRSHSILHSNSLVKMKMCNFLRNSRSILFPHPFFLLSESGKKTGFCYCGKVGNLAHIHRNRNNKNLPFCRKKKEERKRFPSSIRFINLCIVGFIGETACCNMQWLHMARMRNVGDVALNHNYFSTFAEIHFIIFYSTDKCFGECRENTVYCSLSYKDPQYHRSLSPDFAPLPTCLKFWNIQFGKCSNCLPIEEVFVFKSDFDK